jgi:hypothetical protein
MNVIPFPPHANLVACVAGGRGIFSFPFSRAREYRLLRRLPIVAHGMPDCRLGSGGNCHFPARSVLVRETIKRRKIEGLLAVYGGKSSKFKMALSKKQLLPPVDCCDCLTEILYLY